MWNLKVRRVSLAYTQREKNIKENENDKDIDLELVIFACMILYRVFILCKLTRLFWPNTCLVSMCIIGASGTVNKQV